MTTIQLPLDFEVEVDPGLIDRQIGRAMYELGLQEPTNHMSLAVWEGYENARKNNESTSDVTR